MPTRHKWSLLFLSVTSDDTRMTDKTTLRSEMRDLRAEAAARDPDAGETLAGKFPMKLYGRYGPVVSGYIAINDEIDAKPLMQMLAFKGAELCLPRVESDDTLSFRRWRPGDDLDEGKFGLLEPSDEAERLSPTLLLVPLLAFDATGARLGYGKGHYDKALADLRAGGRVFACGLGFQTQLVDAIPAESHDEPMDWALTEAGNTPLFMMRAMREGKANVPTPPDAA